MTSYVLEGYSARGTKKIQKRQIDCKNLRGDRKTNSNAEKKISVTRFIAKL